MPVPLSSVTDPDVLYASAFASLKADAGVTLSLSPLSQAILDKGVELAGEVLSSAGVEALGQALVTEASALIGTDTIEAVQGFVGEIAGSIADYVPLIGAALSFIEGVIGGQLSEDAAAQASFDAMGREVLSRALVGSGYAGAIQPQDIFAYDPAWAYADPANAAGMPTNATNGAGYPQCPYAPLGLVLAALTEDSYAELGFNGQLGDGAVMDSNLHHSTLGLAALCQGEWERRPKGWVWKTFTEAPKPAPGGPARIMNWERRRRYALLRRAMGSHNADQGRALWPIYLDMLCADQDAHLLNPTSAFYLLTQFYNGRDLHETSDGLGSGLPILSIQPDAAAHFVHQVFTILDGWRQTRAKVVVHPLPKALHVTNLATHVITLLPHPSAPKSTIAQAAPYAAGGGLSLLLLRSLPNILPRGRR